MSKLETIIPEKEKQNDIKLLILELFKESEYGPWAFVKKVEQL